MNQYKMEIMALIDGYEVAKTLKVKANSYSQATLKVYKAYEVLAVISLSKYKKIGGY